MRAQIGVTLLGLTALTVALVGVVVLNLMSRALMDQHERSGRQLAHVVASTLSAELVAAAALDAPADALQRVAQPLLEAELLEGIALFTPDGAPIATRSRPQLDPLRLSAMRPAPFAPGDRARATVIEDEPTGPLMVVEVALPRVGSFDDAGPHVLRTAHALGGGRARLRTAQLLTVLYTVLAAALIGIAGYVLLTRLIVAPIRRIGVAAERVAAGNTASRVVLSSSNEIGLVADSFNRMLDGLEEGRRALEEKVKALNTAKQELERAQDAMIRGEKLASVGRLAAGIAHEVGNPLSAVLGLIEVLDEPDMDAASRKDIVGRIERELLRIHETIRGLLDYSRSDDDLPAESDVEEVIETAQSLVKAQPKFRDIRLTVDVSDDLPAVAAHADRLVQVLVNLLMNAADATSAGGRVEIRGSINGAGVEVSVLDDGPGIDPELGRQIFEPFVTTKPPGQGTGLGLAICERIVEGFGGRLEVERSEDGGACFKVWIPVVSERGH